MGAWLHYGGAGRWSNAQSGLEIFFLVELFRRVWKAQKYLLLTAKIIFSSGSQFDFRANGGASCSLRSPTPWGGPPMESCPARQGFAVDFGGVAHVNWKMLGVEEDFFEAF